MDIPGIKEIVESFELFIDALKGIRSLWHKGEKRDATGRKIEATEKLPKPSDVTIAKQLGMKIWDCTFPPQNMLWKENEQAHVCPNPQCGRRRGMPTVTSSRGTGSWADFERGR
jgi:hypothetical protein